ncbi:MAG: hypothetical protein JST40_09050 [Armatimonadetes bacterium]|nr:hypothetical protein [Armatimonadota bacterium]
MFDNHHCQAGQESRDSFRDHLNIEARFIYREVNGDAKIKFFDYLILRTPLTNPGTNKPVWACAV